MKRILVILMLFLMVSCAKNKGNQNQEFVQAENKKVEEVFEGKCAVFFSPAYEELMKIKEKTDEHDFTESMDDTIYYEYQAEEILQKTGIKIYRVNNKKVVFKKNSGEKKTINTLQATEMLWGIILFNGVHDPKIISAMDVETEIKNYFK